MPSALTLQGLCSLFLTGLAVGFGWHIAAAIVARVVR